jgi:aromatic-L-amino-acid decarboxylase
MDTSEFRKYAHELVDWMADYMEKAGSYPVRSVVQPREILRQIPESPPQRGEPFETLFGDFQNIILPGMTHWQSPSFFAYFPANSSPPSILAEMLTATLGAQCMSWVTSPAATELEERMMQWLAGMISLPATFTGVIQDTASTATLCALLTARERASHFSVNARGFSSSPPFTAYCSTEAHSSVEKAVKIAGLGRENLRKVPVDAAFAMQPRALEKMLEEDRAAGHVPLFAVAAMGTTGSTAIDPLREIGELCRHYRVWLHVDAAFAGSALILPELRWMSAGVEMCDSFVFNPHKWLFTNFDCSAYFVRDVEALVRTFEILPEYLKTSESERVNNYRDWGLQLGRRFRALKLWFVIRSYGVEGLQEKLRLHIRMAHDLAEQMRASGDFELLAPTPLNVLCFRYHPAGISSDETLNELNARLLESLNATGKLYLTHTKLGGNFTLRLVIGQTNVQPPHVGNAWRLIRHVARSLA